jgi:GNAT superfamily N-acetyltransferase
MWRPATETENELLVELCAALHREDAGPLPADARHLRATLATLRREPWRGRAVVCEVDQRVVGYALLIAFWSNELGGEVCAVDELYVVPDLRGRGHGTALFEAIERGALWPAPAAAMALGTTPDNARARRLYERLGFTTVGVSMVKRLRRPPP